MKTKKGQLSIGDAPTVVLIVGFVFLIMATMAYIGEKYGDAVDADNTAVSVVNETLTTVTETGETLAGSLQKNGACGTIVARNSSTGTVINAANYTQTGCVVKYAPTTVDADVNNSNWKVTYTYTYSASTSASNVTGDLSTELSNNTSIAGIVLTISLVGIVLAVLIGIFLAARRGGM